ncbi:hypothetical protein, unknown function [Leishmania infantum JPCM5]|uniref:Uncharacterized protein n=2 Tax=Leishmania infantum TaxID=5671 RepID=A4I2Z2_LEIIN|nr:hypothetical protein, unknown function [Leishmania infantum JPCM5]CAC9500266.1 hypothetical_protein_-_conserved [Leishmania infantum]CAM69144.1 hypothetical protein, unknown function [Leishmania infantum JPCM5]SUZ43083.1 hypothetical_protein_-_conserved [Leishmania infantum]|eukprot:XP_001466425.1 hypothetical protein, unknown function [Leishmania infantum JPCM5]
MPGRLKAAPSEVAFTRHFILSPHRRQPVHCHARHSPVRTPYPPYTQPSSDAAPGGSSSSHLHQRHHYHDPFTHHSADGSPTKCRATLSVLAPPTPAADAAHARHIKHVPCSRAHCLHRAADASAQQSQGPSEAQALTLRSRRWATDGAAVEDRTLEAELARHRRGPQLPPPSSPLLDSPSRTATPTADITHFDASPSRPLPSRRPASRLQRLLRKLEAEAHRTGCTVTDAADGQRNTVELYQALFLQALADSAAWERHARVLEASAQASAKREAHLKRQLRHLRRSVELLVAYVKGSERVMNALGRGTACGTGASTQTERAAPDSTPPMSPGALAASAAAAETMMDVASSSPWSPTSLSAVSELVRGSFGRSLNLVYDISGSDSRHGEDDAAVRKMDGRSHAAVVKGPGDLHELDGFHSESLAPVHEAVEAPWDQPSWDGSGDDVGTGVHTRYRASAAWGDKDRGDAAQRLRRGGTEAFETRTPWSRTLPAAIRASGMAHREFTPSLLRRGASARATAVLEGGSSLHATSPSPLSSLLGHAATMNAAMETESVTHESAPLAAAAAPQVAPTSAAQSLLELLRSRDTSTRGTAALGQGLADTSLGTISKATPQSAAPHQNDDHEVTVAEATHSHSSSDVAHLNRAVPARALSSFSSASRPPLTPSCSSIPRQSSGPKGEALPSHPASLPSLVPSSPPRPYSHSLAPSSPQMSRVGGSGGSNRAPPGIEAAAAAPIAVAELVHTSSSAVLSFPPHQTFTNLAATHQRDGSVAAQPDDGPAYSSNDWEFLETANFADSFGASSSSSPTRRLDEARGGHHRLASSDSSSDTNGDKMTDERDELANGDGYTEWRTQLEAHLNHEWVSGM